MLAHSGSRPVVYDVHEYYLDIIAEREWIQPWLKPVATVAWDRWERRLVRRCAAVVAATDHIAERYSEFHDCVVVVRNFTDISFATPAAEIAKRDGSTCVFAGTLVPERNLANTVKALGNLRRRGIGAHLWLAGRWGSDEFQTEIMTLARNEGVAEQVKYFGLLPRSEAVALQAAASIGLVNLSPTPNTVHSLPIKMLECMALGLPLVYSDFPAFRKIAGACGAGIAVDPTRPEETANAIHQLIEDRQLARAMGQAGMRAAREQFNWRTEHVRLVELYNDILGNSRTHSLSPTLDDTRAV